MVPCGASATFLFCARNATHSPAFLNPAAGSVSDVVPLKPISFNWLVPDPTVIGVGVTVMVLFALAAAYAPAPPNVSAPAARPAAIFTFDVSRNILIRSSLNEISDLLTKTARIRGAIWHAGPCHTRTGAM